MTMHDKKNIATSKAHTQTYEHTLAPSQRSD